MAFIWKFFYNNVLCNEIICKGVLVMDYRSQIKEKMGKLLFLEMNIKGFKESIGIPEK